MKGDCRPWSVAASVGWLGFQAPALAASARAQAPGFLVRTTVVASAGRAAVAL